VKWSSPIPSFVPSQSFTLEAAKIVLTKEPRILVFLGFLGFFFFYFALNFKLFFVFFLFFLFNGKMKLYSAISQLKEQHAKQQNIQLVGIISTTSDVFLI